MTTDHGGSRAGHGRLALHPPADDGKSRAPLRDVARAPGLRSSELPLRPRATRPPRTLVQVRLCDDQEVFRLGLRVVLEAQPDIAVVAETSQLQETVDVEDGPGNQVVVVRQGLLSGSSLPLLRDLCQRGAGVLVLAETAERPDSGMMDVLQAGVRGCMPRRSAAQRLVDAVRALSRDEATLDAVATSQLVRYVTAGGNRPEPLATSLDRLTERQREVAELVAQGLSNEEVAGRLVLSLATVKSHLTAVMRRLDVRTRTQLAILVNRDRSPAA